MSIKTTCFKRRIEINGRKVRLSPPTVRQAVEILHVLKNIEDEDDIELLVELLAGLDWHRSIDMHIHLRNKLQSNRFEFYRFLYGLLMQGYNPKIEAEKLKHSNEESAADSEVDWARLLSQYCTAYPGKDPFDVYNQTPFPFFMEMLPEARRIEAIGHINGAFEAAFAMGGSDEVMKRWQKQAGWEQEKKEEKAKKYQEDVSQEELKKEREKFKKDLMG